MFAVQEYSFKEVRTIVQCVESILVLSPKVEENRVEPVPSADADDREIVLQVLENIYNLVGCEPMIFL